MEHAKAAAKIVLAFVVPFVLISIWTLVLGNVSVISTLRPLRPLEVALGTLAFLSSAVAGFLFVAPPWNWKSQERSARLVIVGLAVVYFPSMLWLLRYGSSYLMSAFYRL